jgi:TonB family protein
MRTNAAPRTDSGRRPELRLGTALGGSLAAASLLAVALAAGAAAAVDPVAVAVAEVRLVDAVPAGPSVSERLAEIRRRIQAALVYPRLARRAGVEGEALLRFEVGRDGAARGVRVFASSGKPSLDRAAVRAVTAAAPLPWIYGSLEVPVRFALSDPR